MNSVLDTETRFFVELIPQIKRKNGCGVYHAGNSTLLPQNYAQAVRDVCDQREAHHLETRKLYLCAAYDPIDEIVSLSTKIEPSQDVISSLQVPSYLDLLIRTGGEKRLSGFLPIQCKYAEIFFEQYFFPEITPERIEQIVMEYKSRKRRFGK